MQHTTTDPQSPVLEMRAARASSVIVQRISADAVDGFLAWQRGISAAAAEFAGYQTTEVYPPPLGQEPEWVVVVHFDDAQALEAWLDSPRRAEWIAQLPREIRDFHLRVLPAGFGAWFAGLPVEGGALPHWKMFVTVLLGLYPTVMLLTYCLSPYTQGFGLAVSMLIGNAVSVAFLEWLGMPVLSRLLGPWLRAHGKETRPFSLAGLLLMVAALGVMTWLFALIKA